MEITVTGVIQASANPAAYPNRTSGEVGPRGIQWGYYHGGNVSVTYTYGSAVAPDTTVTFGLAQPSTAVFRGVFQGTGSTSRGNPPLPAACKDFLGNNIDCYSYSGSQTVVARVLDANVAWNTPASQYSATAPANFYFEWKLAPLVPTSILHRSQKWRFRPRDGSPELDVSSSCDMYGKGCNYRASKSGTMYVDVYINGTVKTLAATVHVGPPALYLTADTTIIYAGDSVRFEAAPSPDTAIVTDLTWEWRPDIITVASRQAVTRTSANSAAIMAETARGMTSLRADGSTSCVANVRSCTEQLFTSGTMIVRARVNGEAKEASQRITVIQFDLRLDCTSAQRGSEATCTATTEPSGGPFQVKEWTFVADSTSTPYTVVRETEIDSKSWGGIAVASGTVQVRAIVAGLATERSAMLWVTPRTSLGALPYTAREDSPGLLPIIPGDIHQLGGGLYVSQLYVSGGMVNGLAGVPSGPNKGLWYFTALPFRVDVTISVNVPAMSVGSDFWYMQSSSRRTNPNGPPYCSRSDLLATESLVRQHEGLDRTEPGSHTQVYIDVFEHDATSIIEPYVSDSPAVEQFLPQLHQAAMQQSNFVTDSTSVNPLKMSCIFNYIDSVRFP